MANLSNINGKFVVEQTTGYVGVGTTDPSYLLHMSSADTTNGTRLIIENTNASGKEYGLIADNTGVFSLRDLTAGSDRLTISSGGDVGIGTTGPIVKLAVKSSQEQLTLSEGDFKGATFDYRSSTGNLNIATNGINARTNPHLTLNSDGLVTLASMSSNDTRQLTFMGDSNSTSGNGGAIGMFADETRITSNWYYNSGQQK